MKKRMMVSIGILLGLVLGLLVVGTSGVLSPLAVLAAAPDVNTMTPGWTHLSNTTQSGPWTGSVEIAYKPVASLRLGHRTYPQFDVKFSQQLTYHGRFAPQLTRWPYQIMWPPHVLGDPQEPVPSPTKIAPDTFAYGYNSFSATQVPISQAQLTHAFRTARFVVLWSGLRWLPPTGPLGWGPTHRPVLNAHSRPPVSHDTSK